MIRVWSQSYNPSSYRPFFILGSKNSLPPILQSWVRSDVLLSSGPLTPSAICHSGVLAAKHSLWKCFLKLLLFHTHFFPGEINSLLLSSISSKSCEDPYNEEVHTNSHSVILKCAEFGSTAFSFYILFLLQWPNFSIDDWILNAVLYCPYCIILL